MEAEATVRSSMNGTEKDVMIEGSPSPKPNSISIDSLMDKRDKMIQGLNGAKAQKDDVKRSLEDIELAISRTEGAIYTLEMLINDIDPTILQAQRGG